MAETGAFIEIGLTLPAYSRFQLEQTKSGPLCLCRDPRQQCLSHPLTAGGFTHIHALDFGEVRKKGYPTSPNRCAVRTGQEKPDIGFEDFLQRQPMLLLGHVFRRKDLIEFGDQRGHVVRRPRHQLDGDFKGCCPPFLPTLVRVDSLSTAA